MSAHFRVRLQLPSLLLLMPLQPLGLLCCSSQKLSKLLPQAYALNAPSTKMSAQLCSCFLQVFSVRTLLFTCIYNTPCLTFLIPLLHLITLLHSPPLYLTLYSCSFVYYLSQITLKLRTGILLMYASAHTVGT